MSMSEATIPSWSLYGNPTSSYLWRNVIPYLQEHGRCIAPNLIAMGDSAKLTDGGVGFLDAGAGALGERGRQLDEGGQPLESGGEHRGGDGLFGVPGGVGQLGEVADQGDGVLEVAARLAQGVVQVLRLGLGAPEVAGELIAGVLHGAHGRP